MKTSAVFGSHKFEQTEREKKILCCQWNIFICSKHNRFYFWILHFSVYFNDKLLKMLEYHIGSQILLEAILFCFRFIKGAVKEIDEQKKIVIQYRRTTMYSVHKPLKFNCIRVESRHSLYMFKSMEAKSYLTNIYMWTISFVFLFFCPFCLIAIHLFSVCRRVDMHVCVSESVWLWWRRMCFLLSSILFNILI